MPSAVRSLSEPATSQKWTNVNSSLFRSRVSSVTSLGRSSRKATTSATTSTPRRSVTSPTVLSLNPRIGKKTPSGPTLSSLTTPWLRAAKPRPFAPPASPSSALPPTPTASKTTAPSARNSSNLPASASFPTKTSIPSTPPLISSRRIPTVMSSNLAVKRSLFVGEEEDGEDVIRMLDAYKKAFSDEIKVFQLQRRINGVEVAVGAFFNGKKFVTPVNINFEHKKLFPGEVGPPHR